MNNMHGELIASRTWQVTTGDRTDNVTYVNDLDYEIEVSIEYRIVGAGIPISHVLLIDGIPFVRSNNSVVGQQSGITFELTIPSKSTYELTTAGITVWSELR